jgi:hypothetical protein
MLLPSIRRPCRRPNANSEGNRRCRPKIGRRPKTSSKCWPIHAQIPGLTRERFIEFAAAVAKLRADYLNSAMACFLDDASEASDLAALRQKRALFEEGVKAYEALHRALERGYIDPQTEGKA